MISTKALGDRVLGSQGIVGHKESVLLFLLLTLSWSLSVFGHELRPAYLELRETRDGEFSVLWKTPMLGDARLALAPEFSGDARITSAVATRTPPGAAVQTWTLQAPALRGQTLRIRGLEWTMTDALVRAEFADGTSWTQRLTPREPSATIPARESAFSVAGVYLKLGVEHILSGVDHLLYILAMLFLVRGWKRVLLTMTAFTATHSLTLTAATLGWVHVPQPPVEACIALSILFVAREIVCSRRGRPGLTERWPWVVSFTFGLLHGFGFAGALSEAGLPQTAIPVALVFFNVGVEVGQLFFILAALPCLALGRFLATRLQPGSERFLRFFPPYAIGSVAMFWVIQRVAAF
jgi:hydrogenase/urease accessory protein HupE